MGLAGAMDGCPAMTAPGWAAGRVPERLPAARGSVRWLGEGLGFCSCTSVQRCIHLRGVFFLEFCPREMEGQVLRRANDQLPLLVEKRLAAPGGNEQLPLHVLPLLRLIPQVVIVGNFPTVRVGRSNLLLLPCLHHAFAGLEKHPE